ncbi:MAG: CRISPR-associated endoribonuclease Cas6, partial [Fimbriimonadales bacterium]|nr:CRISPR-associated endoribonuclease Cas6 [Fimbriimonadales bacterium]
MRLKLVFGRRNGTFEVPAHYNHLVQSLIYRHIDASLARNLHAHGIGEGHTRFRYFTFSRLLGKFKREGNFLRYHGYATLYLASPNTALLESLALRLSVQGEIQLGGQRVPLHRIDLLPTPALGDAVVVRALSPITLRAKQRMPAPAVRYLTPMEPRFGERIIQNLRAKVRFWYGRDIEPAHAAFIPQQVDSERHQHAINFKGTWVQGWTGVYQLSAPTEYLQMALDAGIGERNSAGFGCVE